MSGEGAPILEVPRVENAKIAIVTAQWHADICNALVAGAERACKEAHVSEIQVFRVPGSFEIPLAASHLFSEGYDAVIAVGLVLRGETPHFDFVCDGVTSGLMEVMLETKKPIGFGVLMCNTLDQAIARSGLPGSIEDKGFEASTAAIHMLDFLRKA